MDLNYYPEQETMSEVTLDNGDREAESKIVQELYLLRIKLDSAPRRAELLGDDESLQDDIKWVSDRIAVLIDRISSGTISTPRASGVRRVAKISK